MGCVSGISERQLNSSTMGPRAVIIKPAIEDAFVLGAFGLHAGRPRASDVGEEPFARIWSSTMSRVV